MESTLDNVPRVALAHLPTPLEPAPRLGAAIGLRQLWVKRDDQTGLALGGNKARKLEYLMAEAQAQGADTVITVGAVQSNHARMTAAAAVRLGMDVALVLNGAEPDRPTGNLRLDYLLGARVLFVSAGGRVRQEAAEREADRLRAQGRIPYVVPVGGSTPLGALGYVRAAEELAEQAAAAGVSFQRVFFACGSGGTHAGLLLGARRVLPSLEVIGVGVGDPVSELTGCVLEIAAGAAERFGLGPAPSREDVRLLGEYGGGKYGVATREGDEAVRLAARTEGLILDPVYTGKALSGLVDWARTGRLDPDEPVLFWHTGGAPGFLA